ncbi:MAG: 50S ribosomal protein L29 [candidate division Zixibacteria bacterium]
MRMETLRDLTKDELLQKRDELKQELFNLKLRRGLSQLDNPLKLRTLRRDIAKIETALSEDRTSLRKIIDQTGLILDQTDKTKKK